LLLIHVSPSSSKTGGITTRALKFKSVSGQECEANITGKNELSGPMLYIRIDKGSIMFWLLGLHLDICPKETLVMIYGQSHHWIHTRHSGLMVQTTIQWDLGHVNMV